MFHHNGRLGGLYTFCAESAQARLGWKSKLEKATALRKESSKVFGVETLSVDTFSAPMLMVNASPLWNNDGNFTGEVTCSVPFSKLSRTSSHVLALMLRVYTTPGGRGLATIGWAEGVWIGFGHDSRSMRQVSCLRMVSECPMLEHFGISLVLVDKSLFTYRIEALVPSSPWAANATQTPQKLSGNKDVRVLYCQEP
ncbi:hypothetical protein BDM02DRAFT_3169621 [Thelephora ganbajun]|uniref:Uncharacterized protein n=1 Tax=Thelephora ganbajun TaxID=370292 RepID=A0ACB6ZD24_THEGA|nr:hypothetical protein BDM02DRAFT_3169621 [Thelephora ganbajun]